MDVLIVIGAMFGVIGGIGAGILVQALLKLALWKRDVHERTLNNVGAGVWVLSTVLIWYLWFVVIL